jgi:hypothetical protein
MADDPYLLFVLCRPGAGAGSHWLPPGEGSAPWEAIPREESDRKPGLPDDFPTSIPVATVPQLPLNFRER